MKIKNETVCNQSIICDQANLVDGVGHILIVGESTLEISDELWNAQKHNFAEQLKAKVLTIVEAPKLTEEEEAELEAEQLAAAEALVAKSKATTKPKASTKA